MNSYSYSLGTSIMSVGGKILWDHIFDGFCDNVTHAMKNLFMEMMKKIELTFIALLGYRT